MKHVLWALALVATLIIAPVAALGSDEPQPVWDDPWAAPPVVTEAPTSVNPYLGYVPDGTVPEFADWNAFYSTNAVDRASKAAPGAPANPAMIDEAEAVGSAGANDDLTAAEFLPGVGTAASEKNGFLISGSSIGDIAPTSTRSVSQAEDDSSFVNANLTGLVPGETVTATGFVGDGAYVPTGDFDVFEFSVDQIGNRLDVGMLSDASLNAVITVWHEDRGLGAFIFGDRTQTIRLPFTGRYFVMVSSNEARFPVDPSTPGSPSFYLQFPDRLPGTHGGYEVSISLFDYDYDSYSLEADAGDILGLSLTNGYSTQVYGPTGEALLGTAGDMSGPLPERSPLPTGGFFQPTVALVLDEAGTYTVVAQPLPGPYTIEGRMFRPALELTGSATQVLYLDFNGATVNRNEFISSFGVDDRKLTSLSSFLGDWGLAPSQRVDLIERIAAVVEENLSTDLRVYGGNGDASVDAGSSFNIEIVTSLDQHKDIWGDRYVSRVVIGGTRSELGINTVGIAGSIDVGNFDTEETAVVLLDLLSETDPNAFSYSTSLNSIDIAPGAEKIDLVAQAIGNLVAHEAGHMFANFHTERDNDIDDLMDSGGKIRLVAGVGDDDVFGTADDRDVDFSGDVYAANEPGYGNEHTYSQLAFGLSTGHNYRID